MSILERITARRRELVAQAKQEQPFTSLERTADAVKPLFPANRRPTLIAECKKGSPSKGVFLPDYDPARLASAYARGGAQALSVLTEPDFFFGDSGHLLQARRVSGLPVLRKDFIIDPWQVRESWAIGADAMLLIVAVLEQTALDELCHQANELGLQVLVEAHNEQELERALQLPCSALGINARNLRDFSIDLEGARRLCAMVPAEYTVVAESGIHSPADARSLRQAGFRAFLVGEYFVTAADREARVREMVEAIA